MTILALHLTPDRATLWTDSEAFKRDGTPAGHVAKLTVNTLAGMACVSAGWGALKQEADLVLLQARDLDHLARLLPERLRQRAMKLIRVGGHDPRETGEQTIIAAGWSAQLTRMAAYCFDGSAMFEPVLTGSMCLPDVPEFARLHEPVPHHMVRVAKAQMQELRAGWPDAAGGTLVAAIVIPGSVATAILYDLAGDRWLLPGMEAEPIPAGVMPPVRLAEAA